MKMFTKSGLLKSGLVVVAVASLSVIGTRYNYLESSSHREAPIIANDPLADNTDVYAFRNPKNKNNMVIIANYVPFQHPHGAPNFYNFGENIAYDIHIKNDATTKGDDIMYRFEFKLTNEDPTTHFYIRLGKQNQKATYTCKKSTDGGKSFKTIISNGIVPPYNVGPRSIESAVGLNSSYENEMKKGIITASTGEKVFCGPVDDPFFVDIGGIEDLGNVRPNKPVDGLKKLNVHTIALDIPIEMLNKEGQKISKAWSILDPDFIIGVWASASRRQITVRESKGRIKHEGDYVQVSRLGMPLTNEVIIPIGKKDEWNSYSSNNDPKEFEKYFTNPELALYMDDSKFGKAVPGLSALRIQTKSLGAFDFRNGADGLSSLLGNPATKGTAFDKSLFGNYLLRKGEPRSVDLLPIFMTGVPNLAPYQLVTGKKDGNPLAAGKPFINNFLPTFGDMLRVNMAVPPTDRDSKDFSSLGLVQAAVLGITDPRFNMSPAMQYIPNMDGFPNGRRLEDDVVRIELQAVSGIVLAAVGLGYDDYDPKAGAGTIGDVEQQHNSDPIMIMPPSGAIFTNVKSATFGTGKGSSWDNFKFDASCQADVTAKVQKTYGNFQLTNSDPNFTIPVNYKVLGDPCPDKEKSLRVVLDYRMTASLATPNLVKVLTFTTGVEKNDTDLQTQFPFEAKPWNGFLDGGHGNDNGSGNVDNASPAASMAPFETPSGLNMSTPDVMLKQMESFPNPSRDKTTFRYHVAQPSDVSLHIYDANGNLVASPVNKEKRAAGMYEVSVNVSKYKGGIYYARIVNGSKSDQTLKFVVSK
ncbi:hypothetical protein AHMF7605_24195 [Adhaeribacter arboris]|uniref:Secretion system C-terminal sorting domain-containing protein n=1 Tax=Adhaeribacter arboris TaxID=2072846 RepID=A0A2T2YLH9_9BACT|nr:DUF4331 family protein [Adhaeribacter arboris]PSR56376.1 hypothetical protein AHMF7605_24195 [Adhaeribacter arboris]